MKKTANTRKLKLYALLDHIFIYFLYIYYFLLPGDCVTSLDSVHHLINPYYMYKDSHYLCTEDDLTGLVAVQTHH